MAMHPKPTTTGAKEHAVPRTGMVAVPRGRDSSKVTMIKLPGGGERLKNNKQCGPQ